MHLPVTLYVATSNAGKLRDFAAASTRAGISLEPLPGLEQIAPPVEDADTFAGNAALKAAAYSVALPGGIVLADDSGLEVDALGGAPGVHSARYAALAGFPNPGHLPTDDLNNACLLQQLSGISPEKRTSRYRCVLAAARDGELLQSGNGPLLGSGSVEGAILVEGRGTGGFGYDPLFLPAGRSQSMAEIALEDKLLFSHRGLALTDLLSRFASMS